MLGFQCSLKEIIQCFNIINKSKIQTISELAGTSSCFCSLKSSPLHCSSLVRPFIHPHSPLPPNLKAGRRENNLRRNSCGIWIKCFLQVPCPFWPSFSFSNSKMLLSYGVTARAIFCYTRGGVGKLLRSCSGQASCLTKPASTGSVILPILNAYHDLLKLSHPKLCETFVLSDITCTGIPYKFIRLQEVFMPETHRLQMLLSRLHKLSAFPMKTMMQLSNRGITAAFGAHGMFTCAISPSSIHCGDHKMALTEKFSFHHAHVGKVTARTTPQLWEICWQSCDMPS